LRGYPGRPAEADEFCVTDLVGDETEEVAFRVGQGAPGRTVLVMDGDECCSQQERAVDRCGQVRGRRHVQVEMDGVLCRTRVVGALQHEPWLARLHRPQPDVLLPRPADVDTEQGAPEAGERVRVAAVDRDSVPPQVHRLSGLARNCGDVSVCWSCR
jgi:hypothetical protein